MVRINPQIYDVMKEYSMPIAPTISYLVCLSEEIDTKDLFDEELLLSIPITKIVDRSTDPHKLIWLVPLYQTDELVADIREVSDNWIHDIRDQYKVLNKTRAGSSQDFITRMKQFTKAYPIYSQEDIKAAFQLYFKETTPEFLKDSNRFIFEGAGQSKTSKLLSYCERVKEGEAPSSGMVGKITD